MAIGVCYFDSSKRTVHLLKTVGGNHVPIEIEYQRHAKGDGDGCGAHLRIRLRADRYHRTGSWTLTPALESKRA